MTPSEILMKHEDANDYHFYEVDRKWIIEAMEEYAGVYTLNNLPSDEDLKKEAHNYFIRGQLGFEAAADTERAFKKGAKWVIEHVKKQK